mgnify:CR=1 FL=1
MIYCRIFKITFPNEFSKESFDSFILTNHSKAEEKNFFLMRITITTSNNIGFYLNFFENENSLKLAWKEKGEALFSKVKSLGAKIEKYEGDVPFLTLNPTKDLNKFKM